MNPAVHTNGELEMTASEIMEAHFELDDLMDSFKPGILYGLATPCINMLKTMLIPGATFCAVPLMINKDLCKDNCSCPKLCKPSELPIYGNTNCCKCADAESAPEYCPIAVEEVNILERGIRNLREGFTDIYGKFQQQKETLDEKIHESTQNVKCFVVYLREDATDTHRMGAIALGGIAGFILGLRGGVFRRLVYMGAGAGGMYYICYPADAERQACEGITFTKKYVKIAYNFMYGAEPLPREPFDPVGCCPKCPLPTPRPLIMPPPPDGDGDGGEAMGVTVSYSIPAPYPDPHPHPHVMPSVYPYYIQHLYNVN